MFSNDGLSPAHSPTLASASSCTPSPGPARKSRFRFGAARDVSLLKQVLQHKKPFSRGSTAWEGVADALPTTLAKGGNITARACRDSGKNAQHPLRPPNEHQ